MGWMHKEISKSKSSKSERQQEVEQGVFEHEETLAKEKESEG